MTDENENGLYVGYITCGCRDCFELTIGAIGDFCADCIDAGCDPGDGCQRSDAYGASL